MSFLPAPPSILGENVYMLPQQTGFKTLFAYVAANSDSSFSVLGSGTDYQVPAGKTFTCWFAHASASSSSASGFVKIGLWYADSHIGFDASSAGLVNPISFGGAALGPNQPVIGCLDLNPGNFEPRSFPAGFFVIPSLKWPGAVISSSVAQGISVLLFGIEA